GLAPTVVVSTTDDPATPYEAGVALADQLGASLVTFEGNQHTASFAGNACVDDVLSSYLVDLVLPAAGLRC
ncbi:MAG: alpha/beta hydrolase, partial [Rhodococcus sp. (in: high G+C Gram-positive bacteria)]